MPAFAAGLALPKYFCQLRYWSAGNGAVIAEWVPLEHDLIGDLMERSRARRLKTSLGVRLEKRMGWDVASITYALDCR